MFAMSEAANDIVIVRRESEQGGYEVTFQINPLLHLAPLMRCGNIELKFHFGIIQGEFTIYSVTTD